MLSPIKTTSPSRAWFWAPESNTHVCRERHLFKEYTSFRSSILCSAINGYHTLRSCGIGTVELSINKDHRLSKDGVPSTLRLVDVLYVPSLPFSVIAAEADIGNWTSANAKSYISDTDGNLIAYFQANEKEYTEQSDYNLVRSLVEQGHRSSRPMTELSDIIPVGPVIVLSDHPSYMANNHAIFWHKYEQMRWQTYKRMRQERGLPTHGSTITSSEYAQGTPKRGRSPGPKKLVVPATTTAAATIPGSSPKRARFDDGSAYNPAYNPAEEMWLKSNFGSERVFLEMYRMDAENYKHRCMGRKMVRSIMRRNLDEGSAFLEESFKLPGAEFKYEFMQALHLDSSNNDHWENAAEIIKSCVLPIEPLASKPRRDSGNGHASPHSQGLSVKHLKEQFSQFLVGNEGTLPTPGGPTKTGMPCDKVRAMPY
ncbi:hypothetical protein F4803DRAFT_500058 [Xylaria telfairii]|nr:hypothetical protein F4803DRAFT_500058 [Xylaria telfairii]